MTQLTLDNWKTKLYELLGTFGHANNSSMVTLTQMFCLDLLSLQKQSLKDEAVKRIEDNKTVQYKFGVGPVEIIGKEVAQDIIRNL